MITDIRLQHFRSYSDDTFEFEPGVNIIVGPNASGKTNLLEAVLVSSVGKSYRAKDAELVAFDSQWARIDAHSHDQARTVKLQKDGERTKKSFTIDDQQLQRLSLNKTVPVVLFEPNHLQLLNGSPELRREFIDGLLEQTVAGYGTLLKQYRRTLAQRNALLKKDQSLGASQLFAWNIRLSELGGQVAGHRYALVERLSAGLDELYGGLAGTKSQVSLDYTSRHQLDAYSSHMLKSLERHQELDFARGFTGDGPHRDDIAMTLNGHPTQESASRGETRTLMLALKVKELQLLEESRGQPPLLLLDDVFSELDGRRRRSLTNFLKDHQTFITTTDADVVVQHFMDKCHIIPLS